LTRARFVDAVLAPFLGTRLVLVVVAWLSISLLPISRWVPTSWTTPIGVPLLDAFSRWDATNYLRIATDGYRVSQPTDVAFFPLYPLLVRSVSSAVGATGEAGSQVIAILLANVALLAALVVLVELADLDLDTPTASRTALYALVFPTSFVLSAAYAESLLLFLTTAAMLAGRRQHWWLAGALGALATLARPVGFLILLPLAIEAIALRRQPGAWRSIPGLLLVPAALTGYGLFLALQFGDAFAFLGAEASWGRHLMPPWETLAAFFGEPLQVHSGEHSAVNLLFTVLGVVLAVAAWRLLRPSYAAFLTALILVPLCSGSLLSMPRFLVADFPVFLVLAIAGRRAAFDRLYVIVGVGLGAAFMVLFAAWYWVA
jgi:mannosyltransferase PIG-V